MKFQQYETHDFQNREIPVIYRKELIAYPRLCHVDEIVNWHENVEIWYCCRGKGDALLDGVLYNLEEGDICVINSNTTHSAGSDDCLGWEWIIIDNSLLAANGIEYDKITWKPHIKSAEAVRLFKNLVSELKADNKYKRAGVCTGVLNLVLYLLRNHSYENDVAGDTKRSIDKHIKNAIKYINLNYMHHINLEDAAERAGLSKFYFSRELKEATGMTFVEYTNKVRCMNAKELILKKQCSVNEAARLSGFENYSYFTKTFKRFTGHLPSEYIKLAASGMQKK